MKTVMKSMAALAALSLMSACAAHAPVAESSADSEIMSAHLDGGSYKALQRSDPMYERVVTVGTTAAYEAAPTRALVQTVSVMQAATGEYFVDITMGGQINPGKRRLVVVSSDEEGELKSNGVIVY